MTKSLKRFDYSELTEKEKKDKLTKLYSKDGLSWGQIAELAGTYPNRLIRDARKFNIPIRTKSEAQKLALENGSAIHPTAGMERPEEVKNKIGKTVADNWQSLSDEELQRRSEMSKKSWESKTEEEVKEMQQMAAKAIRLAAIEGSKLEKAVLANLVKAGYKVLFHKEQFLKNERLQLDLFIPSLNIAIEIDGPVHSEAIWGKEKLEKNIQRDRIKNGLLLASGIHLIRVKQTKNMSTAYGDRVSIKIMEVISSLKDNKEAQIVKLEID